jgi:hypothetical protein
MPPPKSALPALSQFAGVRQFNRADRVACSRHLAAGGTDVVVDRVE